MRTRSGQTARGDAHLEGTGGREGGGLPCQDGEGTLCEAVFITASRPGSLSQFAFPRPLPGYFGRET